MFCLYFLTGKFCHLLDPEKIERFERYQRQVQTVFSYYKRIHFLVQVFSDECKHKRLGRVFEASVRTKTSGMHLLVRF